MLVSSAIPNLVNGVSQQPYVQRLISQGEIQYNGYSSLVEGLRKRPPTNHLAKISATPLPANSAIHTINRSGGEQYEVIFNGSTIQVFDMAGNPRTVSAPNGWSYVTTSNPLANLRATTVADYTFITNNAVTVANDGTTAPASLHPYEALVWCRAGDYSTDFALTITWSGGHCAVNYHTPDAVTVGGANTPSGTTESGITTERIAVVLLELIQNGTSTAAYSTFGETRALTSGTALPTPTFTAQRLGSCLYIYSDTTDFTVDTVAGAGDTDIIVSKGPVQNFSNLPAIGAPNGIIFEVNGTGNDGTNPSYFVQFQAQTNTSGIWNEVAKPGEVKALNAATMPYQLVRNGDGTFTFEQATWAARHAGSLATCPLPSFVGRQIVDVFFYQGRLGFLAAQNVIMSQTSSFFDFTRTSALQLLDTDPIDISSTNTSASILRSVVPFQTMLVLFADTAQYQLTFANLLSPKTVAITPATNYEIDSACQPVSAGSSIYFPFNRGSNWTGLNEYYLEGASRVDSANDITSQVPKYIPGLPLKMAVAANEGCLVVLASGDQSSLYVYRYYWQGGTKLQSSWSQWQFGVGDVVLGCEFIQNTLFLVINRADGAYLESIAIQPGLTDGSANITLHLDRKLFNASNSYNSDTNTTTITLPYAVADWTTMRCVSDGGGTWDWGVVLPITGVNSTQFTVPGNPVNFCVGRAYTFQYRFSTFITHEPVPMTYSMQAVQEGRLQIRAASVNYAGTGYFRAVVNSLGRSAQTYVFSPGQLGQVPYAYGNSSGGAWLDTGIFKVPVMSRNTQTTIDLINDSHLPCFFESAGWEGFFVLRSQRTP